MVEIRILLTVHNNTQISKVSLITLLKLNTLFTLSLEGSNEVSVEPRNVHISLH